MHGCVSRKPQLLIPEALLLSYRFRKRPLVQVLLKAHLLKRAMNKWCSEGTFDFRLFLCGNSFVVTFHTICPDGMTLQMTLQMLFVRQFSLSPYEVDIGLQRNS
jgi:hypothetical protein